MKIERLFDLYEDFILKNSKTNELFSESGMVNDFRKLDFGFFPLGTGILNKESKLAYAEIQEGGTFILGNDFGTLSYIKNKCGNKREEGSITIKNLETVGLNIDKCFFSNLFMGLRDDVNHPGTTMTKLIQKRQKEYIDFCKKFLKIQIDFINPKVIVCLGSEVGKNLSDFSEVFAKFSQKKLSLTKMYELGNDRKYIIHTNDNIFGKRKFILIPHPSYAHINWNKNDIKKQIEIALKE